MTDVSLHKFDRWLQQAWLHESPWRKNNNINYNYYYGDQFSQWEEKVLNERHQPVCVLNYIRPLVDMILSMEKDRKIEFRVVGREPSDDSIADLLTALVKQISD